MINRPRFFGAPPLWGILCGVTLAVAQLLTPVGADTAQAATTTCTPNGTVENCTVTFAYSGAPESWAVPTGVTQITIDAYGAQGGDSIRSDGLLLATGGRGGKTTATLTVQPGTTYQINVGGQGNLEGTGGFNGGGNALSSPDGLATSGGGASDLRSGNFSLTERVIVAGGGGGTGNSCGSSIGGKGGAGGGASGGAGLPGFFATLQGANDGGGGGTQTEGGIGGTRFDPISSDVPAQNGSLGMGGAGAFVSTLSDFNVSGGGGGGGYYGGGGGGYYSGCAEGGGGGGGSGFGPAGATFQNGVRSGNGLVSITYSLPLPDTTAPVITPQVNGTLGNSGWYVSNVTVSWTVVDGESAVSSQSGCQTQNVTSDTGGVTFTCSATSAGGTASESVIIKRDATAPTITFVNRTAANSNGWNNSDVTVNWSCSDATSGVVAASVSQTLSNAGANQTATGSCSDNAGNSASNSQNGINIDKTAPTISAAATTQPNGNGWYNSNITVHFTCADALSGLAPNACPADQVLSSEGSAVASTAQTVTDLAGNSSTASNVVTVKIDKTAAVVTITGVSNGASYTLGSVPIAGCSTTDALSGVATPATLSVTGGNPDGTGSFTATCSGATDNAGNNGSASATYTVAYPWSGFLQPVDNLPTVNTVNAGQGIPVKFSLGGNYGLTIFAAGYPKMQTVACSSGGSGSSDAIEETVTAGNSSLQYDATTKTYTYVWKTDKTWAGTCRQLIVKLIDGTEHIALFQFNGKGR